MQLNVTIQGNGFDALANLASEFPKKLPKEVVRINNNTAKAHRKEIGKNIRQYLNVSAKGALEPVDITKRASIGSFSAEITVDKTERPGLKYFGARQTKKGVSYKIDKGGKRKTIKGAFGPGIDRLGGHVFKRKGKERLPIMKLRGVSIARVYTRRDLVSVSATQIRERMEYESLRRLRALNVTIIRRQGRRQGLSTEQINQKIKSKLG